MRPQEFWNRVEGLIRVWNNALDNKRADAGITFFIIDINKIYDEYVKLKEVKE